MKIEELQTTPHPPTVAEAALMARIFQHAPERTILLAQAREASIRWEKGHSLALLLDVPARSPTLTGDLQARVAAEASTADTDGVMVHAIAHLDAGRLYMIDIYREDGVPLREIPAEFVARGAEHIRLW